VLFVLTTTSLFGDPPSFDASNITVITQNTGPGGSLVVGSVVRVTVADLHNLQAAGFTSATCDFSQFGGPANQVMTKITNEPGFGEWRAIYTLQLGTINAPNRKFSVTATNADGSLTVQYPTGYTVNVVPPMDATDITASRLRVNEDNSLRLLKIGDTINLIASFKTYIDSVWIDWGHTFAGAPVTGYDVVNGALTASYQPQAGSLSYTLDLTIRIVTMKSTNGLYSDSSFYKDVSKNQLGEAIRADLNPPSLVGAWDLWYDTTLPLRFSPNNALVDDYNTQPNTFDIYLKLPQWAVAGGASSFKLRFVTEDRTEFFRTFNVTDSPATVTESPSEPGILKVTWDGKDNNGIIIAPNAMVTVGITLWEVSDAVGNIATISHISGDEFPFNADTSIEANHAQIHQSGADHTGQSIINRIHVVVDNLAPTYAQNLALTDDDDVNIIRMINDDNNNSQWDSGETVIYTHQEGVSTTPNVEFKFQAQRSYTVDTNPLRHESEKYWVVLEKLGTEPSTKWFWTGSTWAGLDLFDQETDKLEVTFDSLATYSDMVNISWNISDVITFPGNDSTGINYKLYAYLQDNAGNITKSQNINVNIKHIYMNIPLITDINVVSEHIPGDNGLPVSTGGIKNFYLTSAYSSTDTPYTGNYYVSKDTLKIELVVNNRDFLKETAAVEVQTNLLGGTVPQTYLVNRSDFTTDNKYVLSIPVTNIGSAAGSTVGTTWAIGGDDITLNYIRVISYAIEHIIDGVSTSYSFDAADEDYFNLVIPEKPQWPTTDLSAYNLTVSEPVFSPGNPLYTYDAGTNPANDNVKDTTEFSFFIPPSNRNISWWLRVMDNDLIIREWLGTIPPTVAGWTSPTYIWDGLTSNYGLAAGATEVKTDSLKLIIQPEPYGDPGYIAPPNIIPKTAVTIDNQNPTLVSGGGTTIDAQRKITLDGPTPVVTQLDNTLQFTLYTSEYLPATIGGDGWNVLVRKADNTILMNDTTPVTASITNIIPGNGNATTGYKTFNLTVTINGLEGTVTNENTILIVRLPWDKAGNPGHYNNPEYPYNADVWHLDSAEYYLTFHVLDAKPKITEINFTNKTVTGTATYVSGNWNPAATQGWVRDGGTPYGNFTLTATVTGGAYRAMHTDWTANLQPLLGGTGSTNTAVVPTAVSSGSGSNESLIWTLTWTGFIPADVANAWTNDQTLQIPITIITRDGTNPVAHTETKSINIKVDKSAPIVSTTVSSITANGTAQQLNFTVTDTGSGIYWDTITGNPYGYVGEQLTLTPNTGMTINDTGNGTFTVSIPTNSAVKYFEAKYTVIDNMGNQTIYYRYINVIPVPQLSNVKINSDASIFVPGNSLTVSWNLANYQRASGIVITLSATGVDLSSYTTTITSNFSANMSYTFQNFFLNNTGLDGKTLTATVTGYTTGYSSPTSSATGNIAFTYSGNNDTIAVDTKPVISSVVFKHNGQNINVIQPNMSGIQIVATVTSTDTGNTANFPMTVSWSGITGTINITANPTVTQTVSGGVRTRTYTWDNVSVENLTWTPTSDYKVVNFVFNCQTNNGYAANAYTHQMVVLSKPTSLIQGIVASRTPYNNTDPDGWFAPEHLLSTQYTFMSMVNEPNPPITADFDLIEDNIIENLRPPIPVGETNGSTKTTVTIIITQGGSNVTVTAYKYVAKWRIQPDVQSVWNAYDDGTSINIDFAYQQISNITTNDTRSIKVDKKVPVYDTNQLWVATGTTTPTSWDNYFINEGFNRPITLALTPNGQWPTSPSTQKIYIKYRAKDGIGAGVIDIATPTLTGWTIAQVSHTELSEGVVEKVISLTPNTPGSINSTYTFNLSLAKIQDKVGHINYGNPANSTDPAWTLTAPALQFKFSSDYLHDTEFLTAYQYVNGNRLDDYTAPYVKKGANFGFKMKLADSARLPRGVDVSNIIVSGIDLNTYYVTNATGTGTTWTALTPHTDGSYYLNTNIPVSSSYADGAGIKVQYRVNYTIYYTDGTSSTANYVSEVINNAAIVDASAPVITSVKIWSESLGITQEGYVVPFDQNGTLEIKFTDVGSYKNPNTVPILTVSNLNKFVSTVNGVAMTSPYTVPAYNFSFANNVWTATIDSLVIISPTPLTNSVTIAYSVTDPVGNYNPSQSSGNRMVEIAAEGPIVPIIRDAELITTLPDGQTVRNYIAQGVPAVLKVYIDTQYQAYIEQVWANAVTGVSYGTPIIVEDTDPDNNYRWIASIPVTPTSINNYTSIDFVVNTKRNPFGGNLFQDTEEVHVVVDGNNFIIANPIVKGVSAYMEIPGMINPAVAAVITAEFNSIGEQIATGLPGAPAMLPNNSTLASWFTIQNISPNAFINIPTPVVTGTGNNRLVTWNFAPADINQALAADVTQLKIKFNYRNIYGINKTSNDVAFNVDRGKPVIANNGIKFYIGNTVSQTANYSATSYIANNQDWTKVRFELNDPPIRTGVNGSGLNNATVTLIPAPETYIPNPNPLAPENCIVTSLTNGYIELQFINGFSAYDLAEGFYKFTITAKDNLENEATYVQQLLYWHSPSQIVINPPMNANVDVMKADGQVNQQQITAFPADPTGQVQGVHFHLYQDVNGDGVYQAATDTDRTDSDIISADGNPDMQAPYTVMWDMSANHYKYLVDPVYGRNPIRKFLVRASAISQGRAVTDTIVVVNVKDNQPPIPNVPTYSGNTTFDYDTPANNVITLSTSFAPEWIDAEWAIFEIYSGTTLVQTINANYISGVANTTWNYNGLTPGQYTIAVKGKDFVGNISNAVYMSAPITISNPASLISYDLNMVNVLGFNNEPPISNNTIYGTNNPASAIGTLRLDANFFYNNPNDPTDPLNGTPSLAGINSITFKAKVINNVTGEWQEVNVPNDTTLQPDYPATGPIIVTPQIMNRTISIFVPDSFYMPTGYNTNDFTYEFFIALTPTNPAVLQDPVYSTIRLDYFAPRVAITENTPNITWSRDNLFKVTGDITDIDEIVLKWSDDNMIYRTAVYDNRIINTEPNTTHYIQYNNWNTKGGSENTLLNYAGAAWLKVEATDLMGNTRESTPIQVYVDNVAPNTPVTHIAYRSHPDNENHENPGAYANIHTLGSLYGEANNTITAITSAESYGTSTLRIYVDPAQITNLSTVAINDPNFNTYASWYNGTNDFRPPIRLYHGYSATGNINNITWTDGVLYDHEPMNGLYEFDIPYSVLSVSGYHYFVVSSTDTRGNVEGDTANNGIPIPIAFDGNLSPAELQSAIDLVVNIINVADVETKIVSHTDNQIVGEWINLAADITKNIGNVPVNQVRFEYKVNNVWTEISTVNSAPASNVKFHLYRKDIPQYDGLPFVPGVHLYNADSHTLIDEMLWNSSDQSWEYTANLTQGEYNFEYRLDLNNDGIINGLDLEVANRLGTTYIIQDPNHFTHFKVTPWVTSLNTELITTGIYEFRALPLAADGNVLFNQVAISRWLLIDNNAPNTTITVIGGIQRIRPVPALDAVTIVADVNELLVAADDIVEVKYQYSSQPETAPIRRWVNFGVQSNMGGNYQQVFTADPAPLYDLVDNDNDGLVDEADEADATYYLRAIAYDQAGNYFTSNIYTLFVDGSAPQMLVDYINGIHMNANNNIFTIPETGVVTVTAHNITPANFDAPVLVHFEYSYKNSVSNPDWSDWTSFDTQQLWIPVFDGTASQTLPYVNEGYYRFRAIAKDVLGNTTADTDVPITYVVFDDIFGSNAHITMIGSSPVISDQYAFAQNINSYSGSIKATIDNPTDINTLTFEWATSVSGPWVNINTVATCGAENIVANWTPPAFGRVPYLYLRVVAQDVFGNNESEQIVKLYIDNTTPGAVVDQFTYGEINGKKWLNNSEEVSLTISYTNLPEVDLNDIALISIRIINNDNNIVISETYSNVNEASSNFTFTANDMASLIDGIYNLEIELTDFAGNTAIILPADYQELYIDTQAPNSMAIVSTSHPNNIAVYSDEEINFEVSYNDLIGLDAAGALIATFTYMDAVDIVNTYTLDALNQKINFTWNPSEAFEQYIITGEMNIVINAEVKLKDLLGNEGIVPNTANFFTLTYGIPENTRLMAVRDFVNDDYVLHYVNWNLAVPQVQEMVGTNHTGNAQPLELYAYIPHQAEIPTSVDFAYRLQGNNQWIPIASVTDGDSWDFIDNDFHAIYQRQYFASWNIVDLAGGAYEVRVSSHYPVDTSHSIAVINIYNGTIVPQPNVDGLVNTTVQRGKTYTISSPSFTGSEEYLQSVIYKYRYVNVNNSVVSPISQWMYFGDVNGDANDTWIPEPYTFEWTVYPYYLFNNTIQVVAFAKDIWGTETPINSIINNNAYALVQIIDTQAPDAAISYTWNGLTYPDLDPEPDWVSGVIDSTLIITATITSDVTLADLVKVEFKFNDILIGTVNAVNGVLPNDIAQIIWNELPDEESVTTGVLKVITYDVYGNTNEATVTLNIDNVLPTADFTIPEEIERGTDIVLNANPLDNLSGLLNVTYAYAPVTVPATPWIPIKIVVETPWTFSWTVPANLIFGAEYIVQAKVTDNVGNILEVTDTFTVIDNQTPMQIVSVAGHIPVNGIIPVRLHKDVHVVTQVNDVSIPRVEYVIRAVGATDWTHLEYADVVGANANVLLTDVLTDYAEGNYELGIRAREARVTLGQISDYVTITLDHSFAITATETVPASNGFFNGDTFTVTFTVNTDDEIEPSSIALQYHIIGIDGANDPWRDPVIDNAEVARTGANTYRATFSGIDIIHFTNELLNGMFDFRFSVSDLAEETPNTDNNTIITNVMYDTTDPEIVLNGITGNGVTENEGNYTIQLATTATIDVNAWDVLYGQITQVASGIDKVEFWYNYNDVDVLIGTDTEAPYSIDWNTAGMAVGNYNLGIMAYDKAGNVNGVAQAVTIVPPANWEPYALITAMSFNGDNANQDILYAEVANWNNEVIEAVTFEYFANNIWTPFATISISNPITTPFEVRFNAELMNAATKIRTVVTYDGGLISTNKPELNVAYEATEGGKLVVTNPTINANVFYNNEVRITGALSAPIVTTLYNGVYDNTPAVQIVDGTQTAFFNILNHGKYEFWTASIDYENWIMQLNSTVLNTTNIGTISHNGIALTVPNGSFAYYEDVEPAITLPLGYAELSNPVQTAFIMIPQGDINLRVTLAATPDPAAGTIVGMYYNGDQWINVTADVIGNVVTFTAPSGFIYAVGQYIGTVDFNVVFNSIAPQYVNPANNELWTVANPNQIKFFVYDGFTDGGYTTPAAGEITYQMYIDDIAVPAAYNNGFITAANIMNLTAGEHIASVVVTRNNVNISAEKVFKVDITAPVIVATGTQLTVTNRTISATITDPETAISDAHLHIMGWNSDITVPLANMTVSGNTYSYTLTMDDLNALGYDINYTMEMQAEWDADNNLEMNSVTALINYSVNIEGPAITFTGFANGWWLNPTFNTPLTFTVTVPDGRTMPTDGVWIELAEVTPMDENLIQQMTLAPVSVSGNVYSYSFNFGQMLSPMATAVKLYVEAMDNYNIYNMSEQTYGIDMAAPIVWALAPVGAPIDNDGDGLFNEDPPNGVNEDMDWVDLDQDGFWDPEEPQIVDEDPIDYYPAVLAQGTDVVVAVAFEDFQGMQIPIRGSDSGRTGEKNSRTSDRCYTGASGIDVTNINVTLNGAPITGIITAGTFTHDAGILPAGHYTVVAAVGDIVGNVGSLAYEFDVVGGAPTIVINPLNGNWWMNTTGPNTFTFTVNSVSQLANGGVVANIYAEPSNALIQGPITPTSGANNQYSVILYGGVVPADQTAVRLEVIATDVWGGTSTSNQTFLIDNNAPVITILTPVAGTEVAYNEQVSITATVTDNAGTRGILKTARDTQDRSGSGLQTVTMTVTPPTGTPVVFSNLTGAIAETVTADQYGNYAVTITAQDVVGNESVASTNFVVAAPAPEITFQALANESWWLNSTNNNKLSFTVNTAGINLAVGGVVANVYTIPANVLFQGPVTPTPVNDVYSIDVMGGVIPADQTGIRLEVSATNILGGTSTSNQIYGIDNSAPVVTIISPAENTQVSYNATVNIMATISDIVGTKGIGQRSISSDPKDKAGSGIASVNLIVLSPDGSEAVNIDYPENTQVITKQLVVDQYGTYNISILAKDNVGNQAMATRNFIVTPATAPTISFTEITWLNSVGPNNLNFTINAVVPVTVTANVITYPSGATIMGPLTVNPENDIYTVILNGGMIPAGETSVRLQVIATDQFGNVTEANHYYGVDRSAPVITILNPVNGAEITLVDETTKVRIEAQFSEFVPLLKNGGKNSSGSGIAGSRMVIIDPNGIPVGVPVETGAGITEVSHEIDNLILGTYTVRVTAWDNAGNQAMETISFTMISAPLPPAELAIADAYVYPNPSIDGTAKFAITLTNGAYVKIQIYDFAGREVRTLSSSGKVQGKSKAEIVFDGRNNDGVKLARGAYFARVIANDGTKIVEKVVKIAIK
jgi:hypothetical protein